jgi:hypothetical protein
MTRCSTVFTVTIGSSCLLTTGNISTNLLKQKDKNSQGSSLLTGIGWLGSTLHYIASILAKQNPSSATEEGF